jgi:hypothetical protein
MNHNMTVTENLVATSSVHHLEDVLEYLDTLHTAASENESQSFTSMDDAEMLEYLREIVFTAREAIREIERERAERRKARPRAPMLRLVEKVDRAG